MIKNLFRLILVLLALNLAVACGETNSGGDGDIDTDAQLETDVEPSDGDFESDNIFDGDEAEADIAEADGLDEDDTDNITDTDTDPVDESDGDNVEDDEEYSDNDFEGIDLPQCGADGPYPCITTDLPFEYTDDEGEFRLGSAGSERLIGSDVWDEWIVFHHNHNTIEEPSGLFIFNYTTKIIIMLSIGEDESLWPSVRDGKVAWCKAQEKEKTLNYDDLYLTDLNTFNTNSVSTYQSAKITPKIFSEFIYWRDSRLFSSTDYFHIYTLNDEGEDTLVDQYSNDPTGWYDVYGKRIIYTSSVYGLILIDGEDGTEELIMDDYLTSKGKINGDEIFLSDNRMSPIDYLECGNSIIKYDIPTGEETVLVQSDGVKDYLVEDVWEDWLLYSDFSEGGGWEDLETCCYTYAHGDLILRYMPSGEEWNITNHAGNQYLAQIWDHLVIWSDSRANPSHNAAETEDLYGRDLCMHPELKYRFPACPDYNEESNPSRLISRPETFQ